jgi:branched-chain amino acid transport system substrate-binding protein
MAVDALNARGGLLGRTLELLVADETQIPAKAIEAVRHLAGRDVDVLIGGTASGTVLAELAHVAQAGIPYLVIGAASPAITRAVGSDAAYRCVFRAGPMNAVHQAQALRDFVSGFVVGELGCSNVALIGEDGGWVSDALAALAEDAAGLGAQVCLTEAFDPATQDFQPQLARVREARAEFLVLMLAGSASEMLVQQWYDAKPPFAIGGVDVHSADAGFFQRTGGKAISEITSNLALRAPVTTATVPFWDAFVQRTGRAAPLYTALSGYDAVNLYAQAVTRAGSTQADAVLAELERSDFVGTQGRLQFDVNHDLKVGPGLVRLAFAQWQADGRREVVWPLALRTAPPIPPPWMKR